MGNSTLSDRVSLKLQTEGRAFLSVSVSELEKASRTERFDDVPPIGVT
jgi:hypothetical protein